jgi:hypothetical protein
MEIGHLKNLGIDRMIILKLRFKKLDREAWTGLIWIRRMNRWQASVNAVTNLRVPKSVGNFFPS